MDAKGFSSSHDHILVFQKSDLFQANKLFQDQNEKPFTYFDEKTQKFYRRRSLRKEGAGSLRADRPKLFYALTAPDGQQVFPIKPDGTEGRWRWEQNTYDKNFAEGLVEWVRVNGGWEIYVKQYKAEVGQGQRPPETLWLQEEVGHNHEAKQEVQAFNPSDVFSTPKPERLIERVLTIATQPDDWALDSFAGSGTTGAVAHKMGRHWIMVELGEHCHTHIIPRLQKVIDGTDQGGISKAVEWKGGGGFRYYRLAPSLLEKDKWGNWVINRDYNAAMLAEAVCKLEGFTYAPSDSVFWQHGHSTERDFIYVTTQNLNAEQLQHLSDEVGAGRSLLVMCAAFRGRADRYPNLTIKKIPNTVLARCEWGHDDYSLQVENLPQAPKEPMQTSLFGEEEGSGD